MVCRSLGCGFRESLNFVNQTLDLKPVHKVGFISNHVLTDDWEVFDKYCGRERISHESCSLPLLSKTLVDYYYPVYPVEWEREGIGVDTILKYDIRFDITGNKIVIPHYDGAGKLVGIRGRALNPIEVSNGIKYMPLTIGKDVLSHPTAYNLYGLHKNRNAIIKTQKIMVYEAEKSVLKCDGFYGSNNFTVAACGSNVSNYQRDLILSLGVKEVFIAFDKEYHEAFTAESDAYSEKILKIAYKFCPYVTTYVLWDIDGLLGYKDAPCDKGKSVLEQLMKTKYEVLTREE